MRHALSQPGSFNSKTLKDLEKLMLSTFTREEALKEESAWHLSKPIFNTAVESTDKPQRDRWIARYTEEMVVVVGHEEG